MSKAQKVVSNRQERHLKVVPESAGNEKMPVIASQGSKTNPLWFTADSASLYCQNLIATGVGASGAVFWDGNLNRCYFTDSKLGGYTITGVTTPPHHASATFDSYVVQVCPPQEVIESSVTDTISDMGLSELLEECKTHLNLMFPSNPIKVRLKHDPDEPGSEVVQISVLVNEKDSAKAIESLRSFDEDWWLDNYHRGKGLLSVTLDFECDSDGGILNVWDSCWIDWT